MLTRIGLTSRGYVAVAGNAISGDVRVVSHQLLSDVSEGLILDLGKGCVIGPFEFDPD